MIFNYEELQRPGFHISSTLVKQHIGKMSSFSLFVCIAGTQRSFNQESQLQWPGQHVIKKKNSPYIYSLEVWNYDKKDELLIEQ